jgi:predicted phage terminase large subunit-like protein
MPNYQDYSQSLDIKRWTLELVTRQVAAKAQRDLLIFTLLTKPDYRANWHHVRLAQRLTELADSKIRRLIVCMPPGHGKSELVCRRFPSWVFGRDPQTRIILVTHTATLAEAHSRDVRRIVADRWFQIVFPNTKFADRGVDCRDREDFWEWPEGGYLRATGIGGAITGLRADLAIIDDPIKSREEAESAVYRQRLWEWFTADLYTRLSRDGRIIVCSTRWHRDDLVGRLLRLSTEPWEMLCFPALAADTPGSAGDPRNPGEALWPDFLSREKLLEIRKQDIRAFAALYQQDPVEAEGTEFPESYFGDWLWLGEDRWPPIVSHWVMAIDPSKGRLDSPGDYAAIVIVGVASDRHLLYVDADIAVRPPEELIRRALELYDLYRPVWVAIETNQYHGLLERLFERESMQRFGIRIPAWPIMNLEPKIMRIRRLSPYLAHRELRFRATPHCRLLVEQLQEFPLGRHDDGPDALEMAVRILTATAAFTPERQTVPWEGPIVLPWTPSYDQR